MPCNGRKLKKQLDKLLKQDGVAGYAIQGNKIKIFVETDDAAKALKFIAAEGYEVELIKTGKFEAL
ncbi:MAG: hypothetical protein DRJ31_08435 [Candidatus Methanomethylicota archaeon]|uniref:Uncharacterized protein n=1 Tax=Thermoproteota archaeon TaxID=2056631 RepID=A0A497ELD6_9CREN|nr:MAG: hypothetical protein DRJ31_08435 [Candidatus Verstraetearchaeota archaeon]